MESLWRHSPARATTTKTHFLTITAHWTSYKAPGSMILNPEIPPTEVWWIVQIQPTEAAPRNLQIPPTEVGGWFRSDLRRHRRVMKLNSLLSLLVRFVSEAGSEPSTNFPLVGFKTRSETRM